MVIIYIEIKTIKPKLKLFERDCKNLFLYFKHFVTMETAVNNSMTPIVITFF